MVCAQPAKQRRRPALKQQIRWLPSSAAAAPAAPTSGEAAAQQHADGSLVEGAVRGELLLADSAEQQQAGEVLGFQTVSTHKSSLRIDIDPRALEDAMATILVALYGGLGDAGLALREEDLFLRLSSAAAHARASPEETAHFAAAWRAALSALTALGLVQRLGAWFVASSATLDETTLPTAALQYANSTPAEPAVTVDVVATVPFAQSRNFCERAGRLQRRRDKAVRRVLRRLDKVEAKQQKKDARARAKAAARALLAGGRSRGAASALRCFDAQKAAENAARSGVPVFVSWRRVKVDLPGSSSAAEQLDLGAAAEEEEAAEKKASKQPPPPFEFHFMLKDTAGKEQLAASAAAAQGSTLAGPADPPSSGCSLLLPHGPSALLAHRALPPPLPPLPPSHTQVRAVRVGKAGGGRWRYDSEPAFLQAHRLSGAAGHCVKGASNQGVVQGWLEKLLGKTSDFAKAVQVHTAAGAAGERKRKVAAARGPGGSDSEEESEGEEDDQEESSDSEAAPRGKQLKRRAVLSLGGGSARRMPTRGGGAAAAGGAPGSERKPPKKISWAPEF